MIGLAARLILRYVAGFLIAKGVFAPTDANAIFGDPELAGHLELAIGATLMLGVEGFYALAKKLGWRT